MTGTELTALSIARALQPAAPGPGAPPAAPRPADVIDLAATRFHLTLTPEQARAALTAARQLRSAA